MPSNKTRDRMKQAELQKQQQIELTGKNEVIYKTVGLCPVLDNDGVIYKIVELSFTADRKLVSMEEIDRCRTQGTAMNKLENAFNEVAYNIGQLRKVVKELKKEQLDE